MVTFRLLRISIDNCEANGRATTKVRLVSEAYHRAGGQICGQTRGLVGGQKNRVLHYRASERRSAVWTANTYRRECRMAVSR